MHQFLLPYTFSKEPEITLTGEEFHYLVNVLRLKEDASFEGMDRDGNNYNLRIVFIGKESLVLECKPVNSRKGERRPSITLYQCICKGKKMDSIVRQATEIGVTAIIPVISEYTIPKIDTKDSGNKMERWNRIVREAVQQSASPIITEIKTPVNLAKIENYKSPDGINLFFHQRPLENRSLHEYLSGYPSRISLLIGPEGGLSESETKLLQDIGFYPVFLKTNILRAETAAVYGLSAVQTILMEREYWQKT